MKKFSIIIALLLVATLIVGCTPTVPTQEIRWDGDEGEEMTYDIRLVNTLSEDTSTGGKQFTDVTVVDEENFDQLKPLSVSGKYVTKISKSEKADYYMFTTSLTLNEQYYTKDLTDALISQLKGRGMITEETSNAVTITTTVTSEVEFYYYSLKPTRSTKTVKGVYVGKLAQTLNDYSVSCVYTDETKKSYCQIDFTDNVNSSNNYSEKVTLAQTTYYDNEMLFLIVRSYDMTAISSSVTSLYVMDPLLSRNVIAISIQAIKVTTTFYDGVTADNYKVAISNGTGASLISHNYAPETITVNGAKRNTYRTLKMQQGYLVYTLAADELGELIAANPSEK